jgi:putative ABC transport system substrate-binding protein
MIRFASLLLSCVLIGQASAQTPPQIGYLGSETPEVFASRLASFRKGLASTGFEEGRNVTVAYRWANSDNGRLPTLAAELAALKPAVIATPGSIAASLAAKRATLTIPIVFETGADPVRAGLIDSLNRPSGNITGIASLNSAVLGKRIELLRALQPRGRRLGLLVNPSNPVNAKASTDEALDAAAKLGLELRTFEAAREDELDNAFAALAASVDLAVIANESFFNRPELLARLARKYKLAAAHQSPEFARNGGLLSYGGDVDESHRLAGIYAGRILKGDRPGSLPVQQVTRILSAINARTAREIGLQVPPVILSTVDEVID